MNKFYEYDWDLHVDSVLDNDSHEVKMMKTYEEKKDGDFIWVSCVGGFRVFDTWDDLEVWKANENRKPDAWKLYDGHGNCIGTYATMEEADFYRGLHNEIRPYWEEC